MWQNKCPLLSLAYVLVQDHLFLLVLTICNKHLYTSKDKVMSVVCSFMGGKRHLLVITEKCETSDDSRFHF